MKITRVFERHAGCKTSCAGGRSLQKEVDLLCGRYVVDAKSMLGVFSLPCFDDVKMRVEDRMKMQKF